MLMPMPNVRSLFIPDPGMMIAEVDLDRADAQVVAWEADDAALKQMFREGRDIHTENAKLLNITRPLAKRFVHLTNYCGKPRMLAMACGMTVHQAELAQSRWFGEHPGILWWHERLEQQLMETRTVYNKFGFRRFYFDRIDSVLKEAVAWIPQSTVGLVINRGWKNLYLHMPQVQVLLQVHDSLVFQFPKPEYPTILPLIQQELLIPVPYDDPLTIPVGIKVSEKSWGECEEVSWKS